MPSDALAFRAPCLTLLATEPLRALFEFCSSAMGQAANVVGDGHPVIVYPGLGASALTTSQLRSHLKACGFEVYDWDRGVNNGPDGHLHDWLPVLVERVRELHAVRDRKVSLVGWSLGGVYAREIAKSCPEAVRQVVTLATPHAALAEANHASTLLKLLGGDGAQLTPDLQARLRERPPVPTTSIYSKSDGVVCWRGCLEQRGTEVENVAVDASHLGMPSHPDVLRIVADRLAQAEGKWRPYRRRAAALRPRANPPSRSRK